MTGGFGKLQHSFTSTVPYDTRYISIAGIDSEAARRNSSFMLYSCTHMDRETGGAQHNAESDTSTMKQIALAGFQEYCADMHQPQCCFDHGQRGHKIVLGC